MNQIVWVCQNFDWFRIQDANFNKERHLLKGWSHTGRCGWYELVPREVKP